MTHLDSPDTYLLLLSLVVLGIGPLLHHLARRAGVMLAALDGFVFVAIGGLVLLHVIPQSLELAGWVAVVGALLGLLAPSWVEHRLHGLARQAHLVALLLALVGIALHAFVDGLALVNPHREGAVAEGHVLPMAVILHRLPVGLTIWFLLRPAYGPRAALATLALIGLATTAGFFLGEVAVGDMASGGRGVFQALVAGSLLHVMVHRSYPIADGGRERVGGVEAGLGAAGGLALVWALADDHGAFVSAAVARAFQSLALETAPALLVAYGAAGLVHAVLPRASMAWMRRGRGLSQAVRGLAFGLPLPICSGGVVPVYRSLVLRGVPAAAGMSFLVATRELSLDAVLISLPLLGVHFTLVRVFAAAAVALAVGWGMSRLVGPPRAEGSGGAADLPEGAEGGTRGVVAGFHTALTEVVDSTAPWILLGLAIAAVVEPAFESAWVERIPDRLEVALFALLGIPTYVCASGATPLVAVLIYKGVSPGAALAFLLTGPATNITTFGVLASLHGRRIALLFGSGIAGLAILLGTVANRVVPVGSSFAFVDRPEAEALGLKWICLALVGGLFLASLLRRGPRRFVAELTSASESGATGPPHGQARWDPAPGGEPGRAAADTGGDHPDHGHAH